MIKFKNRLPAIAAAMLMLTVASPLALAQEPSAEVELAATPSGNADRVDGKHALAATSKVWLRKNRLIATNKYGYLPSNIVKPMWSLIKGKPAALADGSISWDEVADVPAGFADGKDDIGYTRQIVWSGSANAWSRNYVEFTFDDGLDVDFTVIPEDVGAELQVGGEYMETRITRVDADQLRYRIGFLNDGSRAVAVSVRARLSGTKSQVAGAFATSTVRVKRQSTR